MDSISEGLVSPEQVARRLGVTIRYVRRLVAERRISYVKVGHLVRFESIHVEEWIDRNRTSALEGGD